MDVSKEPFRQEIYDDEDKKIIISLLNEYSQKLLDICERIEINRRRMRLLIVWFAILCYSMMLILRISVLNTVLPFSIVNLTIVYVFSIGCLLIITTFFDEKQKRRLLERDARSISVKLEKVIRIASQAEDHILTNFVNRIELDLRLADSESALQHYTATIRTKSLF